MVGGDEVIRGGGGCIEGLEKRQMGKAEKGAGSGKMRVRKGVGWMGGW